MNDHRLDPAGDRKHASPASDQPDGLTVCFVGFGFLMALALGIQKWFLAPRYAAIVEDFGVELDWITRIVVLSPRILAVALAGGAFLAAFVGLYSRKVAMLAAVGLLVANIVMLAIMLRIEEKLREKLARSEGARWTVPARGATGETIPRDLPGRDSACSLAAL